MLWGIELNEADLKKSKAIVQQIHKGSVLSEWNKIHSDRQLLAGDQCMEVNGRLDAQGIARELSVAQVLYVRVRPLVTPDAIEPWLQAARDFELNTDFDVAEKLKDQSLGLRELLGIMKSESAGKSTIQAIGDKILLSQLLDNMKVPQMPLLFSTRCQVQEQTVQALRQVGDPTLIRKVSERSVLFQELLLCFQGCLECHTLLRGGLAPAHDANVSQAEWINTP